MKYILDTLLIKLLFLLIILLFLYLFRKIHIFLAPKDIKNFHSKFYPIRNHIDSMHFFSRLLSIGIILSSLTINTHPDLVSNLLHFLTWSVISMFAYFASVYIIEGIVLNPFEYQEEIHNKKNYSYAVVSSCLSICCAFIIKAAIVNTGFYFLLTCVTYALTIVLFIAMLKFYNFLSIFKLKNFLGKDRLAGAISYCGFIVSIAIICIFAQQNTSPTYQVHLVQIMTKVIFAMMLFPMFKKGIIKIFRIQNNHYNNEVIDDKYSKLGYGIFEGATFCLSAIFTSLLMPAINITSSLPIFNASPTL